MLVILHHTSDTGKEGIEAGALKEMQKDVRNLQSFGRGGNVWWK